MFTDIEGYTALMQKSEQQAMALRDKHRTVFNTETAKYGGEILQYYGDGTLSVFDSAVKAVECAIAIQASMRKSPIVPLRIGIHSGDIVYTEDDIIGDGVNVASRIESLAISGSILISDKVYDEIKNHASILTKYLRTFSLKNVENSVGIYAVTNEGLAIPGLEDLSEKIDLSRSPINVLKTTGKKFWFSAALIVILLMGFGYWIRGPWDNGQTLVPDKVVAVIPFEVTGEEKYFQAGMTQGLITELSKMHRLQVIDQKTTKYYAGMRFPFIDLKEDLPEVDFVIHGNVSRSSNRVMVNIRLLVSGQKEPIWNGEYNRDISEIRKLWSEAAKDLATPIGLRLNDNQILLGEGIKPVQPELYELYLKGTYHLSKSNPQDWQSGITYLHQAVDMNPADAFAYAALAEGYVMIGHGPSPTRDVFPKAKQAAMRAIQLDSTLADAWAALAHYETYFGWNWELAEQAFNRANRLNPNLAMNHFHRAWYLMLFGRKDESIKEHQLAEQLDPFNPLHTAGTGLLYSWIGQYEKALNKMDEAINSPGMGNRALGKAWKAEVLSDMGRDEEAMVLGKEASESFITWRYVAYGPVLIKAGRIEEGKQIINELEQQPPTALGSLTLGFMYALLEDSDSAIKWLSNGEKHGWYPWIRVWPGMGLENLYGDPRFLELLEEMNLPPPEKLREDDQLVSTS